MSPRVDLGDMHRLGAQVQAVNELHRKAESDGLCLECGGVWPCRTRNAMNEAFNQVNVHVRKHRAFNRPVWSELEMRPHVDSADCWCEPTVDSSDVRRWGDDPEGPPVKTIVHHYEHFTPEPRGQILVDPRVAAKHGMESQ